MMCTDTQLYTHAHKSSQRETKPINSSTCMKEIAGESISEGGCLVYLWGCDGMAGAISE